jgi:hypothetical protein
MECQSCNVKSSVGFCSTCKMMLCEACGIACMQCGRLCCKEHVQRSSSGKRYCMACYEARRAEKRSERSARDRRADADSVPGGTSFAALTAGVEGTPPAKARAEEIPEEELVLGKWEPPAPWKLCLYTAVIGLVATVVISMFPGLRKIILPGGGYIPTPYFLLIIPVFALFWAAVGIYQEKFFTDRLRVLPGVGLALFNVLVSIGVVQIDVKLPSVETTQEKDSRAAMDEKKLETWRDNMLDKYR